MYWRVIKQLVPYVEKLHHFSTDWTKWFEKKSKKNFNSNNEIKCNVWFFKNHVQTWYGNKWNECPVWAGFCCEGYKAFRHVETLFVQGNIFVLNQNKPLVW